LGLKTKIIFNTNLKTKLYMIYIINIVYIFIRKLSVNEIITVNLMFLELESSFHRFYILHQNQKKKKHSSNV